MSVDTGLNITFNPALPIPGIKQSSQGLRDNFNVLRRAVEFMQEISTDSSSAFSVESFQGSDGTMTLGVGFKNNAFVLPTGDPSIEPVGGMIRYQGGILQLFNGTSWGLVNGPNIQDIIAALELDPSVWTPSAARHGHMTDPSLHALAMPSGNAGFMSGTDKQKLDDLTFAYDSIVVRSSAGQTSLSSSKGSSTLGLQVTSPLTISTSGNQITIGADLPSNLAVPNGAFGFMSGPDKAKLDNLTISDATPALHGYLSASDKTKLDALSQSFNRINVNNGPILASSTNAIEIDGINGISVNAVPNQQKITISLNNIGGIAATDAANTLALLAVQRSRNSATVVDTAGEDISSVIAATGLADIMFVWTYPGQQTDIDGFKITVREATVSTPYNLGAAPTQERTFSVSSDKRSFTLSAANPIGYYTFFIQAFRLVGTDIASSGMLLSNARKCLSATKNPYQPQSTYNVLGNLTGAINGTSVAQVLSSITDAKNSASWPNIVGPGKPTDYADKTSDNIAKDTMAVGGTSATQLLTNISTLGAKITSLASDVQNINLNSGVGASALQQYVNAAQLAQTNAQQIAALVNSQYTSIGQATISVQQDRTTAQLAQAAAATARDLAAASAAASATQASNATTAASAAQGLAQVYKAQADAAGASALSAQSSDLSATLSAAQTRPSDFSQDGKFWRGFVDAAHGVTYQNVSNVGRTLQQFLPTNTTTPYLAPLTTFIAVPLRRIRAYAKLRYLTDGTDLNNQQIEFRVYGIDTTGTSQLTTVAFQPVAGYSSGGKLFAINGWTEFSADFVADSAFCSLYTNFNIGLRWNTISGNGKIEIVRYSLLDVTESSNAAVSAVAAVTASSAALVSQNAALTSSQAASQAAITAQTAAGAAQTYRSDAAESASTANTAMTTAIQQSGVATNAALDSQTYSSAAASHADRASSEADRSENSADAVSANALQAQSASQNAQQAASAANGVLQSVQTMASDVSTNAASATLSATRADTSANAAKSSADAAVVSAELASTNSTATTQSANAAKQSELNAKSYQDGAATSANAASVSASNANTSSSLTSQYADAANNSSLSAKITVAATLPSTFAEGAKFWSGGSTGTATERALVPLVGSFVSDVTYGQIFQSVSSNGSIAPLSAQQIIIGKTYRVTAIVRVLTNNAGQTSKLTFKIAGLNSSQESEVATLIVGEYNPLTYLQGWVTITKDITNTDLSGASYFRPVVLYNQTTGVQTIQIRLISIEDITQTKNAQDAAAAAINTLNNVVAYQTATQTYAAAAQASSVTAATQSGQALTYAQQAAQSKQDADGSANNASMSAGVASTTAIAATGVVKQTFPSDFSSDGTFYTNQLSGQAPSDPTIGDFVNYTDAFFILGSGQPLVNVTFSRSSSKIAFDATGALVTQPNDTPVYQYDPVSGSRLGLWIENTSQNLIRYSNDLTQAWANVGTTLQTNLLTEDTSNGLHYAYTNFATSVNQSYTVSAIVTTPTSGRYFSILLGGAGFGQDTVATFDLQNSVVVTSGTAAVIGTTIVPIAVGRFLVSFTATSTTTANCPVRFHLTNTYAPTVGTYTGTTAASVNISYIQVEAGTLATSRILTTSSFATRAADVVQLNWAALGVPDSTITVRYTFDDRSTTDLLTTVVNGLAQIPYTLPRQFLIKAEEI